MRYWQPLLFEQQAAFRKHGMSAVLKPVGSLSFTSIGLINNTVLATFGSTSFLEMKSAEANIPILVISEMLRGKLFAVYQYCRCKI